LLIVGIIALPFRAFADGLPWLNTAGLFGIWFVALCWSNALLNRRLPDGLRLALGALALGWLLMAFVREGAWVSGWLPALLAFLLVTIVARPRLGVVLLLLSIVVVAVYFSVVYDLLVTQQESDGSLGGDFGRLALWARLIDVIQGRIWFGTGPAGYALYYVTFVPQQAMSTHSNYIDILAQMGIVGVLAFAALLIGLWRLGRRTWERLSDDLDRAFCAAVLGALPALAFALWLGDWLVPFVYNQTIRGFDHAVYSWVMLAALCGLACQHRPDGSTDAAA
jgi:O-antigen ligase